MVNSQTNNYEYHQEPIFAVSSFSIKLLQTFGRRTKKIVFQERITPAYSQIEVLGNADIILTKGNVGQITVEISEKNHYLCSLMGAHHYDYCNIDINN